MTECTCDPELQCSGKPSECENKADTPIAIAFREKVGEFDSVQKLETGLAALEEEMRICPINNDRILEFERLTSDLQLKSKELKERETSFQKLSGNLVRVHLYHSYSR